MSSDALSWAWKQQIKPASTKFVLVTLADYCGEDKLASPTLELLINKTCLDRKTIINSLWNLCELGFLEDTGIKVGETNSIKVYKLLPRRRSENGTVKAGPKTVQVVRPRFTPPTYEQIKKYCDERGNNIDPQQFLDTNQAKGWKVGKSNTPMKDWQAAIRTWERYSKDEKLAARPSAQRDITGNVAQLNTDVRDKAEAEKIQRELDEKFARISAG